MQTTEQKRYSVKVYQKTKSFKEKSYFIYNDYRTVTNVHSGCFSVIQKLTFNSKAELLTELKAYYPNKKYVWFYNHINEALKDNSNQNQTFFIIINSLSNNDRVSLKLKKDKNKPMRKRSRKHKRYYDDMYVNKKEPFLKNSFYS